MTALVVALVAGYGTFLVYTSLAFGWRGLGVAPARDRHRAPRRRVHQWLAQAGLADLPVRDVAAGVVALFLLGAIGAFTLFGGVAAALIAGAFAATFPLAATRQRRRARRAVAIEAWPRLIEEVRILTSSAGRSIPQALFEAGADGPAELRPAFDAARREWLLSTDFEATLAVLKDQLADPTADTTCETLLIAHELGGSDLDQRLADLAGDRRVDLQNRKDARARQAGVRFARRFVLIVPLGMAAAGLSVGTGRAAYETPFGQLAVAVGLGLMIGCWLWAGRIMHLPDEERVLP